MRKEQQKILDKAASWADGAALEILQDESRTIKELQTWDYILSCHKNEKIDTETIKTIDSLMRDFKISNSDLCNCMKCAPSFADFAAIYKTFCEKYDPTEAFSLAYIYFLFNSYEGCVTCPVGEVEKLYLYCERDCLNCIKYFHDYFRDGFYTGDNIDSLIKAEKIREKYFSFSSIAAYAALTIANTFSEEELENIYRAKNSRCTVADINLYLFQKHYPATYEMCKECYERDVDTKYCSLYSRLKSFVIVEPDKMDQLQKIFDTVTPDPQLSFSLQGRPIFWKIGFSLTGFSIERFVGTRYVGAYDKKTLEPYITAYKKENAPSIKYLFFYGKDTIYRQLKNKKWIPCSYKDLLTLRDSLGIGDGLFNEYVDKQIQKGCYIWKDIRAYDCNGEKHLPPFTVEEINKYHSLNELMRKKYKHADFVNWNKCDIQWCYAIMQALPKVNKQSQNLLLSLKYSREYETIHPLSLRQAFHCSDFTQFVFDRLNSYVKYNGVLDDDDDLDDGDDLEYQKADTLQIIADYFRMCHITHKKVNLCFTSGQKIKEAHDELQVTCSMKKSFGCKNTEKHEIPRIGSRIAR